MAIVYQIGGRMDNRKSERARQSFDPGAHALVGNAAARRRFRARLLAWYRRHERDLPWRRTRDPYAVWVSEVMLQQTQVATVVGYFERFLSAFPTVEALAAAPETEVLRFWEGLGYYRRARQMHRAAKRIVAEHGGTLPRDPAALAALPGIGRYTAGAIASIAMGRRAAIVESNTRRFYSRLLALVAPRGRMQPACGELASGDKLGIDRRHSSSSRILVARSQDALLWRFAAVILPRREPGRFNQALMDLGREVCTPREPSCGRCPVGDWCAARALGLQRELPHARPRPPIERVHEALVVVRAGGKVMLVRHDDGGRWAGMWDFVRLPRVGPASRAGRHLEDAVRERARVAVRVKQHIARLEHAVTRFRITLDCYRADLEAGDRSRKPLPDTRGRVWVRLEELDAYPMPVTARRLARLLAATPGRAARAGDPPPPSAREGG